jgi:hypothetical protein
MDQFGEARKGLMRASARLGMDDANEGRARMLVKGGGDLLQGDYLAPGGFHCVHPRTTALHRIFHTATKDTVHADNHLIARLNQIGRNALHSRHARATDRESESVCCAEHLAEHFARLIHDGEILWVQMTERWRPESSQYTLRNRAWTGAEKDSFLRKNGWFHGMMPKRVLSCADERLKNHVAGST